MIISKVGKKTGLYPFPRKYSFGKTIRGGVKLTPSLFRVKDKTCFKNKYGTLLDVSFIKDQTVFIRPS